MQGNKDGVSMPVIRRMARYYRYLCELEKGGAQRISSGAFANKLGLTASQVRQDFGCFGGFGHKGYGYVVDELKKELQGILGIKAPKSCILVGAGNLGKAILSMNYEGVGFKLSAVFDSNPKLENTIIKGYTLRPYSSIGDFCQKHRPDMAIICIPSASVEKVATELFQLGIKSFWNFSHYDISVLLPQAIVENVHLNDSMMTLRYRLG